VSSLPLLVSRAEAATALGYANRHTLGTVMRTEPHRWPAPVACRLQPREPLWDLDELRAADRPAGQLGRAATISDPDGVIACLECGRRLRNLGPHLASAHGLDAVAYRARHDLPATAALTADQTRAVMRTKALQAMRADPTILPRLQTGPTPRVPRARHPRDTGPPRSPAAALERQRLARAAGYPDWATAIQHTRILTQEGAAQRLGCAVSTVKRWRNRIEDPPLRDVADEELLQPGEPTAARARPGGERGAG
jgi:hypothetical protein